MCISWISWVSDDGTASGTALLDDVWDDIAVQVAADGMDPALIKERFGDRICLHGAIDTQHVLPHGSPQTVAGTVRQMIDVLGTQGGFILAPSHVLQTDVDTAVVTVNVTDVKPAIADQALGAVDETAADGTTVGTVTITG